MYLEHWKDLDGRRLERFWENILSSCDEDVLQLWRQNKGKSLHIDDWFLNLGESLGTYNIEGQRVLRILLILHNLSFEEHNISVLAASSDFIRMLLLCVHCEWARLRQIALDTLGNIASQVSLEIEKDPLSRLMWRTVTEGILAQDRHTTIRSLEILAKLCQFESNEEVIALEIQYEVCERMFMLLTIQDIMLLIHTLEALYAVSSLGKRTCEKIIRVHKCIAILVDLLTFDPENCKEGNHKNFKLVETFEAVNEPFSQQAASCPGTPSHAASSLTSNQTDSTTQSLAEVDSESFACNWLVNAYEVSLGHSVARNDLYAEYVTACNKAGRKGVVNACVFANCVKNTFPHSGLRKVDSKNAIITFHHDGLRRKPNAGFTVPLVTNPGTYQGTTVISGSGPSPCPSPATSASSSPILKEKLTSTCSSTNSSQSRLLQSSQISPGLTLVSGSSSLIKTLLASKVNKNLQRNQLYTQNPKPTSVSKTALSELLSSTTHSTSTEDVTSASPTILVTLYQSIASDNSVTHVTLSKGTTSVNSPKQPTSCYSVVPLNTSIPVQMTLCQSVTLPNSNVQVTSTTITSDMTASHTFSVASVTPAMPFTQVNISNPVSSTETFRRMPFPESHVSDTSTSRVTKWDSLISTNTTSPVSLSNYVNSPNVPLIYINNTNSSSLSNDIQSSQGSKVTSNQVNQQSESQLPSHTTNVVSTNHSTIRSETSFASSSVNGVQRDILSEICSKVFADDSLEEFSDVENSVENAHNHTMVVDGQDSSGTIGQETAFSHLSNCVVPSGTCTPHFNSLPLNVQITKCVDSLSSTTDTLAKPSILVSNGSDQYGVTKLVLSSPVTTVATNSAYAVTTSRATVSTSQVSETVVNVAKETEIPGDIYRRQLVKDSVFKSYPLLNGLLDKGKSPSLGEQFISLNAEARNGSGENSCVSSPKIGSNSGVVLGRIVLDPKDIISGVSNLVGISNTGSGTVMATNQLIGSVEKLQMGEVSSTNSLHREPETSVSGTDLSSLSDIAQTVECASKVILRTNIENQCIQQPLSNTAVLQPANLSVSQVIPSSGCQTTTFIVSILNPSQTLPTQHLLLRATGNSLARLEEPMELMRIPVVSKTQICQQNIPSSQIPVKRPSTECTPSTAYSADSKRPRHDTKVSSKVAVSYSKKVQRSKEVGSSSIKSSQTAKQNSHSSRTVSSGSKSRSSSHYGHNNKELDTASREKKGQEKQSSCIAANKTLVNKATNKKLEYMCEWKGCRRTFPTTSAVLSHNVKCHVPIVQGNFFCQWENCDSLKRKQFSLLTHIQDHHCTDQYLQTQALRHREISQRGKTTIPPPPLPPRHPGYSPDAAFLAIRRHALQFVQKKDKTEEEESPLTKSIRLTAALILRNLVIYSELACSYLKYYEPELTLLATSSTEGAQTLSHCLAELSKSQD
ncbi:uncharacterized protein LOC143240187 isoform X2 [Tachypleus tridentatus]